MTITKHIVTSANWDAGRGGHKVTGIVLHTMVGYMQGSENRFNDPSSQVSVHYGVGMDGSIRQWVEEANTAYQAGNYAVNQTTIGIEHEDRGNANDAVRTPALYESSSDLVAAICKRYGFPADKSHIFLHKNVIDKSVYPGGTACPDALNTDKIISMAAAKLKGEDVAHLFNTGDRYNLLNETLGKKYADQAATNNYWHELINTDAWTAAMTIIRSTKYKSWLNEVKSAGTNPTVLQPNTYYKTP